MAQQDYHLLDASDDVRLWRRTGHPGHSAFFEFTRVGMQLPPKQRVYGCAVAVSQWWQGIGLHRLYNLHHKTQNRHLALFQRLQHAGTVHQAPDSSLRKLCANAVRPKV